MSATTYALLPVFTTQVFNAGVSINTLLFFRFLMAALCLWGIVIAIKCPWRLTRQQVMVLIPATLVGYCVNALAFFYAYTLISPSMATILFYLYPFFVLMFEVMVQRLPVMWHKTLALVLAFAGMLCIIWDGDTTLNLLGVGLSVLAGVCYACFCSSLNTKALQGVSAYTLSAYVTTLSAVVFFGLSLFNHDPLMIETPDGWFYTVLIAIICTVLATVTIYTAIQWIGASSASIIATVEPVIVFLFGFIFLGEKLTVNIALGIVLVVGGLLIMQWPEVRKMLMKKPQGLETD